MMLVMLVFVACEELGTTGTVKVTNNTGYSIVVDVNDGAGNWLGERQLSNGGSTTYTAEEGAIDGAARYVGDSYWYYADRYLSAGETIYITWTPSKKSTELIPDNMTANGKDAVRKIEKVNPK